MTVSESGGRDLSVDVLRGLAIVTMVAANLGRWHLTLLETELTGVIPHAPETWAVDAL